MSKDNRGNTGDLNSGAYNSGYRNSGNFNSGDYNSGNLNSGDHNSGDWNSGTYNSGDCNSGDHNSGHYNSGNYNSGFFNTDEPNVRLFNKDTGMKRSDIDMPYIKLKVTEWVPEHKMTGEQKEANPSYKTTGGYLRTRTYKEAWALAWSEMDQETKDKFLNLPNFDAEIFKEITGIDVEAKTCARKIVEIDGKKYRLEEVDE